MKKNRISESNVLTATKKLHKNMWKNVSVILFIILFTLVTDLLSIRNPFLYTGKDSRPLAGPEHYFWITGSTKKKEGLYLLSEKQLNQDFPELSVHIKNKPEVSGHCSLVKAVQYNSGQVREIKMPAIVSNIFLLPIPINRAGKEIVGTLPGIGPVLAERIVRKREEQGAFRSLDELLKIKGIGPGKFSQLVDHIILD